jgi:membrane protease YdiL (CAAX protease family)
MNMNAPAPSRVRHGEWRTLAVALFILAAVFAMTAVPYARRFHLGFGEAIGIYTCFLSLLYLALLPGVSLWRSQLVRIAAAPSGPAFFVVFLIPYLVYALSTSEFHWMGLARIAIAVFVPPLIYLALPPRQPERFAVADLLVGIFLIYVVLGGLLRGIWIVPVNLDFMGRLLLIGAASTTWTAVRPVARLNYHWRFSIQVLRSASLNFIFFALIAIPLGFAIGFTAWHPRWHGALAFALEYLEIFLFIALLEELFFRGFLQSLLSVSMKSEVRAQIVVSLLFGLFHILHAPFPNWRYVALASIAGWFYGEAYRKGGGILASACTHAAVDTIWRTFFTA